MNSQIQDRSEKVQQLLQKVQQAGSTLEHGAPGSNNDDIARLRQELPELKQETQLLKHEVDVDMDQVRDQLQNTDRAIQEGQERMNQLHRAHDEIAQKYEESQRIEPGFDLGRLIGGAFGGILNPENGEKFQSQLHDIEQQLHSTTDELNRKMCQLAELRSDMGRLQEQAGQVRYAEAGLEAIERRI